MDYTELTTDGNIAFYKSCEVTELFLQRKNDGAIYNFFTIAVLEEKPFEKTNCDFLCKPIQINREYYLGIQRYWLTRDEVENNFKILKSKNEWIFNGASITKFPQLKLLSKQFIPNIERNRLNYVLKNNFHNASYILEFFDESKINVEFLLKMDAIKKLNKLNDEIKQIVPIDLSIVRDRIGNFIFQFPITILNTHTRATRNWDGVELNFAWHSNIQNPQDCLIQVESTFDKNYMGCTIEEYNKTQNQSIHIGNLEQVNHIKIWSKKSGLILSMFSGTYIKNFNINLGIIDPEPRRFEIQDQMIEIQIASNDIVKARPENIDYTTYISNSLYDVEKKELERSLSFKQYKNGIRVDLTDLIKLITQKDENGIYLWDPFLSPIDIFKTLYYSKSGGVQLKAIGSINDTYKNVYNLKGIDVNQIINNYRKEFNNPNNNNHRLNLEFRIQHSNFGWGFHDRFLIFPGNKLSRPEVYSLGTSINSYAKNHHILQMVSHPQPVIDEFNELWDALNKSECIVWKFPK